MNSQETEDIKRERDALKKEVRIWRSIVKLSDPIDVVKHERKKALKNFQELDSISICIDTVDSTNDTDWDVDKHKTVLPKYTGREYEELKSCINVLRTHIEDKLKGVGFNGDLIPVGSMKDGTKVGSIDELDFLFEIKYDNLTRISTEGTFREGYKVYTKSNDIEQPLSSSEVYYGFVDALKEALETLVLTEESFLRFGGFAHGLNKSSGVRLNEPTVTILFVTRHDEEISIDITPAIVLPRSEQDTYVGHVRENVKPILEFDQNTDYDFYNKLHLVAQHPECGEWHLTSSTCEIELLTRMSNASLMKRCRHKAKSLHMQYIRQEIQQLHITNINDETEKVNKLIDLIVEQIEHLVNGKVSETDSDEYRRKLGHLLSYGHTLLPRWRVKDHKETTTKEHIFIKSVAFKFALLNHLVNSGEQDGWLEESNHHSVNQLTGEMMSTLRTSTIEHSLLRSCYVKAVSLPYYLAFLDKEEINNLMKQILIKCQQVALLLLKSSTHHQE